MKINETGRIGAINPYNRNAETQRLEQTKKSARKDEVSFSAEAMNLLKAQAAEGKVDTERASRIQSLKQQVAAGTYNVDASVLAEKLAPYFRQLPEN
ncbi:flagellar biosynthesis anti-sigma factor FlgM [Paenibacillus sp. CN-4]|uniref:flagellar biosynthesis anti-sigma factor FlgM n=1 Tax=Paenibacillus nanchangensis TaxID=3348343 RepID=UPI00397B5ECE